MVQGLRLTVGLVHLVALNLRDGRSYGKSFRSQDSTSGQARTTCGADSLSDRAVHFSSGIRPHRAMEETPWPGGRGVLQPAGGGNFNSPSSRHWTAGVAVPTRGAEAEGNSLAARGTCVRLKRDDLASVVGAFPCSTTHSIPAELPSGS